MTRLLFLWSLITNTPVALKGKMNGEFALAWQIAAEIYPLPHHLLTCYLI